MKPRYEIARLVFKKHRLGYYYADDICRGRYFLCFYDDDGWIARYEYAASINERYGDGTLEHAEQIANETNRDRMKPGLKEVE